MLSNNQARTTVQLKVHGVEVSATTNDANEVDLQNSGASNSSSCDDVLKLLCFILAQFHSTEVVDKAQIQFSNALLSLSARKGHSRKQFGLSKSVKGLHYLVRGIAATAVEAEECGEVHEDDTYQAQVWSSRSRVGLPHGETATQMFLELRNVCVADEDAPGNALTRRVACCPGQ